MFGQRAGDWAETWEGPKGWGTPVYEYVLDRAEVSDGSEILDCGSGAGRFARMAADLGARVSGIDASAELVDIAAERTPEGDFRVGDLETLPWGDESFDLVTGFSVFQFADDKVQAFSEAGRVSRGPVAVVVPTRTSESGLAEAFKPLFPLFPPEGLARLKQSGIFALSEPGRLEECWLRPVWRWRRAPISNARLCSRTWRQRCVPSWERDRRCWRSATRANSRLQKPCEMESAPTPTRKVR